MSEPYTPTTDEVRDIYTWDRTVHHGRDPEDDTRRYRAAFDRFLAAHDREVREQAAQEIEAHVGITPVHDGGLVLAAQFVREGGQ